jgi:hypothetical protein
MTDIDPKSDIELSTADGQVMVGGAVPRWRLALGGPRLFPAPPACFRGRCDNQRNELLPRT